MKDTTQFYSSMAVSVTVASTEGHRVMRKSELLWSFLHKAFFFFFCVPQLDLWGSPCLVRFLRMWPFFNPTIKVVTFRLRGCTKLSIRHDEIWYTVQVLRFCVIYDCFGLPGYRSFSRETTSPQSSLSHQVRILTSDVPVLVLAPYIQVPTRVPTRMPVL